MLPILDLENETTLFIVSVLLCAVFWMFIILPLLLLASKDDKDKSSKTNDTQESSIGVGVISFSVAVASILFSFALNGLFVVMQKLSSLLKASSMINFVSFENLAYVGLTHLVCVVLIIALFYSIDKIGDFKQPAVRKVAGLTLLAIVIYGMIPVVSSARELPDGDEVINGWVSQVRHNDHTGGTDIYFQRGENSEEYILKTDLQTPHEYWHRNYAVGNRPKILVRCAHYDDVDFFLTRINKENSNRDNMINGALVCNVKNPSKVFK
jgi:hypothetical protein